MNRKSAVVAILFTLLATGLMVSSAALWWVCGRVRRFEADHGGDVYANLDRAQLDERTREAVAKEADPAPRAPGDGESPWMEVLRFEYDDEKEIRLVLSGHPEMEDVRSYLAFSPAPADGFACSYSTRYDSSKRRGEHCLVVTGDFAHRTNVTMTVRRGLPILGKGAEGALAEDYVHTFRRKDVPPSVTFARDGRYLPPGGRRAIAVESVNVGRIAASVRRVEPQNLVYLLSREEGALKCRPWRQSADDERTEDFAGEGADVKIACANVLNEKETHELTVGLQDGGPSNGVYLVEMINDDMPRCEWWNDGRTNPMRVRLVCVSDLALSVRELGEDALGVWVTTLTTGRPVAETAVEVYSSANIKVMEGRTDSGGRCTPARVAKGEPFAVVVSAPDGNDRTFLALRNSMKVDETRGEGTPGEYVGADGLDAFVWTDRGIYRHGETILFNAIVRTGARKAPPPTPLVLRLVNPGGDVFAERTAVTDAEGAILCDAFSVAAEQPSGKWRLVVRTPGRDGVEIGARDIRIEEFAPPQIRVKVAAEEAVAPGDFAFTVSAEHLFGGPARRLRCEGAVVFEDAPFAPDGWKGWSFGDCDRGLKPGFRRLNRDVLDENGECRFAAPLLADAGRPRAAVRVTAQGSVFEDGGRPAIARRGATLHFYPYYIGSTAGDSFRLELGVRPVLEFACVKPDGTRLAEAKDLRLSVERIDYVHSYRERGDGWHTWECERVRRPVASDVPVAFAPGSQSLAELPVDACGDYVVRIEDPATGVAFAREIYFGDDADGTVRTSLANPTEAAVTPDKAYYRVGETPRLTVRAPFAGAALLTVLREKEVYTEVLDLTNATSVVALRPVTAADAPDLNVFVSVVQGVAANAGHLAVRAHGGATVRIRPQEDEIPVAVEARVADLRTVEVEVSAPGASAAVVTVVDEGINLLTDEPVPDPIGSFARPCGADLPLYDLYHRVLPVLGEDAPRANGVKTGGGFGAEMLGRVSPVPTRRFRPLALWSGRLPVTDGKARASVALPEFVGEVRVTAVACSARATGAAAVTRKVTPGLVMMPDAPRFVAPGDEFEVTMPLHNRSGAAGTFGFTVSADGVTAAHGAGLGLARDGQTNVVVRLRAPAVPGEVRLGFTATGFGEDHRREILLPVRPAVAWRETAGVRRLAPGETFTPEAGRFTYRVYDTPLAELSSALEWLADYPHGCLEQTASRVFPLITAGGVLAAVGSGVESDRTDFVAAGVKRVSSMIRSRDFVMWPDCGYAPWDPEVSLYAAHFLVEAESAGVKPTPAAREKVMDFLGRWALSTNDAVSAYACHTLALAGKGDRDRMLRLYDARSRLTLLSRARLARAFVRMHDRRRAEALLGNAESPSGVKEAAFAALALLELDPDDARIPALVEYLNAARDRRRFSWGTTEENAHALLAIGEYYRRHPPRKGERFVSWKRLSLPAPDEVRAESNGISVTRRFLTADGAEADLADLRAGEMVVVELAIGTDSDRVLSDLVVEDLFPGAFEPVRSPVLPPWAAGGSEWVMRSDARDDRMLVFSKRFELKKGAHAVFRYPVRAVSAGVYTLPGVAVEGMYHPQLRACTVPGRVVVRH